MPKLNHTDHDPAANHQAMSTRLIGIIAMVTASILLSFSSALAIIDEWGTAKNGTVIDLNRTTNTPYMLRKFRLTFKNGDHEIKSIQAGAGDSNPNNLWVTYRDRNHDDEFSYHLMAYKVPTSYSYSTGTRYCNGGTCVRSLITPTNVEDYHFVIRGFRLEYVGSDRHIDEVRITEQGGILTVALNDKNDDDAFTYKVYYAWLHKSQVQASGTRSGIDHATGRKLIPVGRPVIGGFHLNFTSRDHHLETIMVDLKTNGSMKVYYGDDNGDDYYTYRVDYVILPSQ